jgi:hypothetical protein
MDGPKPQPTLDGHVPVSVLEHLRSVGIIKRKMLRQGSSMATARWYMADTEPAEASTKHHLRCDDPDVLDGLSQSGG